MLAKGIPTECAGAVSSVGVREHEQSVGVLAAVVLSDDFVAVGDAGLVIAAFEGEHGEFDQQVEIKIAEMLAAEQGPVLERVFLEVVAAVELLRLVIDGERAVDIAGLFEGVATGEEGLETLRIDLDARAVELVVALVERDELVQLAVDLAQRVNGNTEPVRAGIRRDVRPQGLDQELARGRAPTSVGEQFEDGGRAAAGWQMQHATVDAYLEGAETGDFDRRGRVAVGVGDELVIGAIHVQMADALSEFGGQVLEDSQRLLVLGEQRFDAERIARRGA